MDFTWDENSNRVTATAVPIVGSPITATFSYDDANRLGLITDVTGDSTTPGYDANGNRTSLAYPNGVATSYAYNALNRLTDLNPNDVASIENVYGYT